MSHKICTKLPESVGHLHIYCTTCPKHGRLATLRSHIYRSLTPIQITRCVLVWYQVKQALLFVAPACWWRLHVLSIRPQGQRKRWRKGGEVHGTLILFTWETGADGLGRTRQATIRWSSNHARMQGRKTNINIYINSCPQQNKRGGGSVETIVSAFLKINSVLSDRVDKVE
jgi:hypothetical protein